MVIDMSRRYRINFGRKTVKPFKEHDINNMLVLCKKRRNQAEEDNHARCSEKADRWYGQERIAYRSERRICGTLLCGNRRERQETLRV